MEKKQNLPQKSRKNFDELSKKQKQLRHYAKFYATIGSNSYHQLCKNDSMDVSESDNGGGNQTRNVVFKSEYRTHNSDDENYVSNDNNDTSSNSCYDSQKSSKSSGNENNCTAKTYVEKEPNSFSQQLAQICCQTNMNHKINAILGL